MQELDRHSNILNKRNRFSTIMDGNELLNYFAIHYPVSSIWVSDSPGPARPLAQTPVVSLQPDCVLFLTMVVRLIG